MSRAPQAGFRFDAADALVLAIAAVLAVALRDASLPLRWLVPVVVCHFFLFCNVFRVRARHELAWTLAFVMNFVAWLAVGEFTWFCVLASQSPVTLGLVLWNVSRGDYRGAFRRRDSRRIVRYGATPRIPAPAPLDSRPEIE
jgi:hypothetical protein